jgi:hypothetical protein
MFKVAQVKPYGATLTNGFLPTTSPDHPPVYSESESTQVRQGNWYSIINLAGIEMDFLILEKM